MLIVVKPEPIFTSSRGPGVQWLVVSSRYWSQTGPVLHFSFTHFFVWAAVTKYCQLGDSNNRCLSLTVLEVPGSPRSRPCQIQVSVRTPFRDWRQMPSCCILTWQREQTCVFFSSYKGTNLSFQALYLCDLT